MALRSDLCAEASLVRAEPQTATASRVENWVLIEYGGAWPYEPLNSTLFEGSLRERIAAQLAALPRSRLLLIRRPRTPRVGAFTIFYGRTTERGSRFFRVELEAPTDLHEVDFVAAIREGGQGVPLEHPLLLVCTHGRRDRCCARYGQPLYDHLCAIGDRGWIWMSSHVGGDRFAGNLVCLPEGLYFGRVERAGADAVVAAYLDGRIDLDHYRGRSSYPFVVQAAEAHVRRAAGLDGFHDLRLDGVTRTDRGWLVRLRAVVSGALHEVEVERRMGSQEYLTCRSEVARPVRAFVVVGSRVPAAF